MKKQRLLKRMIALVFACTLLLSVSVRADVMVKWGQPGGDTGIPDPTHFILWAGMEASGT